jgi:hypothetical protein
VDEIVVTGISRSRCRKSDQLDAFLRAEELRTNSIQTPVFKASRPFSRLRVLARVHSMRVRDFPRIGPSGCASGRAAPSDDADSVNRGSRPE